MQEEKLPFGIIVAHLMGEMIRVLKKRIYLTDYENITIEQYGLLLAISHNHHDVIQQDMADSLGKDKSTILRLIDSLERKNLVVREPDIADRRKNKLRITEKGQEIIGHYKEIDNLLFQQLKVGLSETELDNFYKVVFQVINNAKEL